MDDRRDASTDLETLVEALGSREAVVELVELWLVELPQRVAALREALESEDHERLGDVAHVLKSTTALLGLGAAELASEVELAGRSGDGPGAARLLPALEASLAAAEASLRAWRARLTKP